MAERVGDIAKYNINYDFPRSPCPGAPVPGEGHSKLKTLNTHTHKPKQNNKTKQKPGHGGIHLKRAYAIMPLIPALRW